MADGNGQAVIHGTGQRPFVRAGEKELTSIYCNPNDRFAGMYDKPAATIAENPIRLNIGAGQTKVPGYTPVDRCFGQEAFPLNDYASNTVDEVRASHILEHFPIQDVANVIKEWARVLRFGGRMRIAVPDWEWLRRETQDPRLVNYVYGGQTDDNDYHKCAFTEGILRKTMEDAGIGSVKRWEADYPDCSAHPCSLNLEGYKGGLPPYKTVFVQSLPRLSFSIVAGCIYEACTPFNIPIIQYQGAFWHQMLENCLEDSIAKGFEWAITHDYDTTFSIKHMQRMFQQFEANPFMDALAPLQVMRNHHQGLVGMEEDQVLRVQYDKPFKARTAHFGLTCIRLAALKGLPKPWFCPKPSINDDWREFRTDADIYFWQNWKENRRTLFIDPGNRVGHLEENVAYYDEMMQIKRVPPGEWREMHGHSASEL